MSDDVKSIFKTLIKVPVIIFVSYLIFNLFAFALTYFKLLGASYVVMQTVAENNYVPTTDKEYIENMLSGLKTTMCTETTFYCETESGGAQNTRTQYGTIQKCGVKSNFILQWPLMPNEQVGNYTEGTGGTGDAVTGQSDKVITQASDSEIAARRGDGRHSVGIPISIEYKIPGLQYYADLE